MVGQLKSVATLKEQEVDSWIGGLGLNLDIVLSGRGHHEGPARAERAPLRVLTRYDAAYDRVLRRFTWVSNRMGLFEELFFMGPKGQVLVSTDKGHEKQQLGMNDYFTEGMNGEFIQEPSYSLSLEQDDRRRQLSGHLPGRPVRRAGRAGEPRQPERRDDRPRRAG